MKISEGSQISMICESVRASRSEGVGEHVHEKGHRARSAGVPGPRKDFECPSYRGGEHVEHASLCSRRMQLLSLPAVCTTLLLMG